MTIPEHDRPPAAAPRHASGQQALGTGSSDIRHDAERLGERVDEIAADVGLSGVIRVDVDGHPAVQRAYGHAHRALGVPNTVTTRFGIASGSKGLTALAVMSLVERGELGLDTTARSLLGDDLALIDDRVTVEMLLAHRSGIGDYLDEDEETDPDDHVLTVPVHELATTEQFIAVLDGHPMKAAPGERFSYCNGGYVVLALLAERASGMPFHDLVDERVCRPAGMGDTSFLRSDELPGGAALGYLHDEGDRTNVFHLPVRGNGDGGIYSTAADVHALWDALFAGRIVSLATVADMVRPRSHVPDMAMSYGLGFWLDVGTGAVTLIGGDPGVGFVSTHRPARRSTSTVIANQTRGSWPVSRRLDDLLAPLHEWSAPPVGPRPRGIEDVVAEQELSLLTRDVRADRLRLDELLHPDFREVGASGRLWTRSELIDALVADPGGDDVEVTDLRARALTGDVVVVTYTSRRAAAVARRSSIWVRSGPRWVVALHQGTPLPPPG